MDDRGIAARIFDLAPRARRALIAVLVVLVFAVSWWSLTGDSAEQFIAFWWPAAGLGFIAVLASRGRRIGVAAAVAVAGTAANLLGDRPLAVAIAFGIANALEVWLVVRVLTRGRAHAPFSTLPQIGWYLVSVGIGTGVFAVAAASAAAVLTDAAPVITAFSLFTSHGSALFVIGPLALVSLTVPLRVPRWEPVAQTLSLVALTVVVFALAQTLALTFLILTTLMWCGYRLPPLLLAIQTLTLGAASTVATQLGVGPFAVLLQDDQRGAVIALQLFLMTHAAAGLFVSGQSADWQRNVRGLVARERDAVDLADELMKLTEQKDVFIASVSHELRTPVTSILGFAEQLTESDLDVESQQASRIIFRNARRLADVIEDVLEFSRLTTSEMSTRPVTDLDLSVLLGECVEDINGLVAPSRDVRVDLRVSEHGVIIRGVKQDLSRVCSNLLSNAVKFSPKGGTVVVSLIEHPETVELRFADDGPGIPLDEQEAVWERFYRIQSDRHRDVPGTGLGLPIVRALVQQRLGGEVSLQSDGITGTTAVVTVPRTRPVPLRPTRTPHSVSSTWANNASDTDLRPSAQSAPE